MKFILKSLTVLGLLAVASAKKNDNPKTETDTVEKTTDANGNTVERDTVETDSSKNSAAGVAGLIVAGALLLSGLAM